MSRGKAMPVKLLLGPAEEKTVTITVCLLYLDTKLKEYTNHWTHRRRDRPHVRRAVGYRANDAFPGEWSTSLNGYGSAESWLLVDRNTGRISQIKLPDFNSYYSDVSWYRDYAAYWGVADDGETRLGHDGADHYSQAALQNHGRR